MRIIDRFKQIDTFMFDVDGVMTDGGVVVLANGDMARIMNTKDGYALALAIKRGYQIFIISGSAPSGVLQRLNNLGIKNVFFKIGDKKTFVEKLIAEHHLNRNNILFMGDDMPDLPVFDIAVMGCCPSDAVTELKSAADYISPKQGGRGCVRDVIEKVLKERHDGGCDGVSQ
ncbi:MAG: KdsC family phosphatase [Niabella sp.]